MCMDSTADDLGRGCGGPDPVPQGRASKTWLLTDQGGGGDPGWFEKPANQYVTGIAEKQHGNRLSGEYLRNLRQKKAAIDAEGAKATLDERMARLEDDLSNLAFSACRVTPSRPS